MINREEFDVSESAMMSCISWFRELVQPEIQHTKSPKSELSGSLAANSHQFRQRGVPLSYKTSNS